MLLHFAACDFFTGGEGFFWQTMNKNRIFLGGLLVSTLIAGWAALPYQPVYQERQCRGSSLQTLQSLQTRLPENPIHLYYLGVRLQEAKRGEEAVPVLARAAALDPNASRIVEALVETHLALGQLHEAFEVSRQFYLAHPDQVEAALIVARFYLTTKAFSPAVQFLKPITQKFPQNAECWSLLAIAQRQINDIAGAAASVKTAVRLGPEESKYWFLQAQILNQAKSGETRASYEQALKLAPSDRAVKADFADFLARSGDFVTAEKLARDVLFQDPKNLKASSALGLVLAEKPSPEARSYLLQGLEADPRDVRILLALKLLAIKTGSAPEAKHWAEAVMQAQALIQEEVAVIHKLEMQPNNPAFLREMAGVMGKKGDVFRCLQYHAMEMHQEADSPAPLIVTASDLHQNGYSTVARRLAERSLKLSTTPEDRAAAQEFIEKILPR